MNIEQFRAYCLSKKGVTESFPFDENVLVFKVMEKMFALSPLQRVPSQVNLKCDPERAISLREEYDGRILPGYHMSKKLWNTLHINTLPSTLVQELIDHSYDLVVSKLTKKVKALLDTL